MDTNNIIKKTSDPETINQICISEYIREARDTNGIKYKWLAEALGTTQSNLSHKLAKDSLYAVEFIKIAIALNMDLNKMIDDIKKQEGDIEKCILNELE